MSGERKKPVLFDVDNVLLNFNAAFRRYMIEELELSLPDDPMVDYYPAKVLGKSREWEVGILTAFQESEHFEKLKPLPYAVESLKTLQKAGCSVVAITACGHPKLDMDEVQRKREKNLRDVFGEAVFKDIHIVPAGESKRPYLEMYTKGYWVEDSVSNALDGREAGHQSFVMSWPHNKDVPTQGLPRIDDLRPFVMRIMQDQQISNRRRRSVASIGSVRKGIAGFHP